MKQETINNNEDIKQQPDETKKLVGIQFSPAGKIYTFESGDIKVKLHDIVIVEGEKGTIIGKVSIPVFEKKTTKIPKNIKKLVRLADAKDTDRYLNNREQAMKAFNLCKGKIVYHNLSMKLVDVDILTGDSKAIFYFTAEERVDFRSLVKDLASALHMRIEMRQIGARDASKSIGAMGSCGLVCCCESHLKEFHSISIQMAKNQGLSPNPAKLTGMCGKLKCCLSYENSMYSKEKKHLPLIGSIVDTPKGKGVISNLDIPRNLIFVRLEETGKDARFAVTEVKLLKKRGAKKETTKEEHHVIQKTKK